MHTENSAVDFLRRRRGFWRVVGEWFAVWFTALGWADGKSTGVRLQRRWENAALGHREHVQ